MLMLVIQVPTGTEASGPPSGTVPNFWQEHPSGMQVSSRGFGGKLQMCGQRVKLRN